MGGVPPGVCPRRGLRRGVHAGPGDKLQQEAPEREGRRIPPSVVDATARPPRLPPGGTSFSVRDRGARCAAVIAVGRAARAPPQRKGGL
ncbi:MAG: hypothetical protein JWR59_1229 [Brevundimonas sp.]|nr:hypothetical protein [Brevundimonas sp.]